MFTVNPYHCWHLADPDGREWHPWDDGTPHYPTEADAARRVGSVAAGVPDGLTPRQFPQPCVTITCDGDGCDAQPDDGVWKIQHFEDEAEARSLADVFDFTVDPDGKAWCGDCLAAARVSAEETAEVAPC